LISLTFSEVVAKVKKVSASNENSSFEAGLDITNYVPGSPLLSLVVEGGLIVVLEGSSVVRPGSLVVEGGLVVVLEGSVRPGSLVVEGGSVVVLEGTLVVRPGNLVVEGGLVVVSEGTSDLGFRKSGSVLRT